MVAPPAAAGADRRREHVAVRAGEAAVDLGFGHTVASEIEAPNMLANLL
jgi:hypothetical protein